MTTLQLKDFGKLYKVKLLAQAFILCNNFIDPGDWWNKVLALNANSISYKKDTIEGTYGQSLEKLFSQLDIDEYVVEITSFLVFTNFNYKIVRNAQEAEIIIKSGKRWSIRAVGVKFYHSYDKQTNKLGDVWKPTTIPSIEWFYFPSHLIDLQTVEQYNSINVGDMLAFMKIQALVLSVKTLKRTKFWTTCSWTKKKITILNGSTGRQMRLNLNRRYDIIKSKSN